MSERKQLKTPRPLADLDIASLADQVEARLGRKVSLIVEQAADGAGLVTVYPTAGGDVVEIGDDVFAELVAANVPQQPPADPLDALASALTEAKTVLDLRAALIGWVTAEKALREPTVHATAIEEGP